MALEGGDAAAGTQTATESGKEETDRDECGDANFAIPLGASGAGSPFLFRFREFACDPSEGYPHRQTGSDRATTELAGTATRTRVINEQSDVDAPMNASAIPFGPASAGTLTITAVQTEGMDEDQALGRNGAILRCSSS
ncbi:MAG: hypothetical protein AAFV43_03510 [Planctomycetota bacterium]